MKIILKPLILSFSLLLFVQCTTTKTITDFQQIQKTLATNNWLLTDNNTVLKGFNGQPINMKFRDENGLKITGFSGCNSYFGSAELTPEQLSFSGIGSTLIACPDMQNEQFFNEIIAATNRYELTENTLTLYKDKILLVTFIAEK